MIGMQYKVILPKNYDMGIIRKRVRDNGYKTDGFPGLYFKSYLITEANKNGNFYNSYAPLYIWNHSQGMNNFIFDGYYDNILESFGWQHIHIGVPLSISLDKDFNKSHYVVEDVGVIPEDKSLMDTPIKTLCNVKIGEKCLGNLFIYNPEKWCYSHFSFYQNKPKIDSTNHLTIYEILHISQ